MKRSRTEYESEQLANTVGGYGTTGTPAQRAAFVTAKPFVPALLKGAASAAEVLADPLGAKSKQAAYVSSLVSSMTESGSTVFANAKAAEAAAAAAAKTGGAAPLEAKGTVGGQRGIFPRGAFGGQPAAIVAARQATEKEVEVDEHTVRKRTEQLELGKNTVGYMRYCLLVPKSARNGRDRPRTPDPAERMSKRRWDSVIRSWRRQLHFYDLATPMATILGGSGAGAYARPGAAGAKFTPKEAPISEDGAAGGGDDGDGSGGMEASVEPLPDDVKKGPIGQGIGYSAREMPASGMDFLPVLYGADYQQLLKSRGYDERGNLVINASAASSSSVASKAPQPSPMQSRGKASSGGGIFVPSNKVQGMLAAYLSGDSE